MLRQAAGNKQTTIPSPVRSVLSMACLRLLLHVLSCRVEAPDLRNSHR
jgi:hypothetical protein